MAKISTIKQKILEYLDYKGIKKVDFFTLTEINYANFKGKNLESELSGDKIVKILTLYPDISAEWLMRSEGEMIKSETPLESVETPHEQPSNDVVAALQKIIQDQARQIARLEIQLEALQEPQNKPL